MENVQSIGYAHEQGVLFPKSDKYEIMKTDKDQLDNMSNKFKQWNYFSPIVGDHIECYAVAQYGDWPFDESAKYTVLDIKNQIMRYVQRMGQGKRGQEEAERDMLKIAHYACMAYLKLRNEEATACDYSDINN